MKPEIVLGIVSVIATLVAALIQRSWNWRSRQFPRNSETMDYGSIHESASFSVDELVKVLDLRQSPGSADAPGTAVLNDTYLVRRQSDKGNGLVAIYGTSGRMDGECISHPDGYIWGLYDSDHMAVNRALAIDLAHLAQQNVMRVVNKVTFIGAYDQIPVETFETHIERPTRTLAFIILFPEDCPGLAITGYTQVGRRGRLRADRESGPMLLQKGAVAYWRITPKKGEWLPSEGRFRIEWRWRIKQDGHSSARQESVADGAQGE